MEIRGQVKKAIKELNRVLEEQYSPEEIDTLEWFTDEETKECYIWRFIFPGDGIKRTFTYVKSTRSVMITTHEKRIAK